MSTYLLTLYLTFASVLQYRLSNRFRASKTIKADTEINHSASNFETDSIQELMKS